MWFADQSGRGIAPDWLLKRVRKVALPQVALGGVAAACAVDPTFDLVGLPRLDLTVHAARGEDAIGFVYKLDPALAPCPTEHGAVLAIHHLTPMGTREEAPTESTAQPQATLLEHRRTQTVRSSFHSFCRTPNPR